MLQRGFYHHSSDGHVFYVTGGKRYWIPNQDELYRVTGGVYFDAVTYGKDAELDAIPEGQWDTISGNPVPFPIGGDGGSPLAGGLTIPGVGSISMQAAVLAAGVLVVALLIFKR